ncbi:flippase-like domain-containing protein [bacterium]|nr:flippase-like domain-containing protein [candidate division CSSED10-310 bacterium]
MKTGCSILFKIFLSVVMIGYLFGYQVDIRDVPAAFRDIDPRWLALGASLHITGLLLSSIRWRFLLKAQDIDQPLHRLFSYYLVGHFFNMFLPTKVGGDIIRIYDTSRDHGSTAQPMAVILVERISGMLTMLLLAALVLALNLDIGIDLHSRISGLNYGIALFIMAIAVIPLIFTPWMERLLFSHVFAWPVVNRLSRPVEKIYKAFQVYGGRLQYLWAALITGLLLQVNYFFHYYFLARSLGFDTSLLFFFVIIPVRTVALMLPFFINGIGLREFFDVHAFNLVGVPKHAAVAFAETAWGIQIAFALLGGIIYVFRRRPGNRSGGMVPASGKVKGSDA